MISNARVRLRRILVFAGAIIAGLVVTPAPPSPAAQSAAAHGRRPARFAGFLPPRSSQTRNSLTSTVVISAAGRSTNASMISPAYGPAAAPPRSARLGEHVAVVPGGPRRAPAGLVVPREPVLRDLAERDGPADLRVGLAGFGVSAGHARGRSRGAPVLLRRLVLCLPQPLSRPRCTTSRARSWTPCGSWRRRRSARSCSC